MIIFIALAPPTVVGGGPVSISSTTVAGKGNTKQHLRVCILNTVLCKIQSKIIAFTKRKV